MRAAILTLGTLGDVTLFTNLGRALSNVGSDVRVGTSDFYAQHVRDADLTWQHIGHGSFAELTTCVGEMAKTNDLIERTRIFYQHWLRPQLAGIDAQLQALASDSDIFISNLKLQINKNGTRLPGVFVDYDPPIDIAAFSRLGVDSEVHQRTTLDLVAMEKGLVDSSDNWPEQYKFTGFWLPPAVSATSTIPSDLRDFVEHGRPPIVATFGSMTTVNIEQFYETFNRALSQLDRRGILIGGWSDLSSIAAQSQKRIFVADNVPYDWLFPRCACVVHHGSTGTTAAVLDAGLPSIVFPQIAAQAIYAKHLEQHGICAGTFTPGQLNLATFTNAIDQAIGDESMRDRCRRWQGKVTAQDGLAKAVALITQHFAAQS